MARRKSSDGSGPTIVRFGILILIGLAIVYWQIALAIGAVAIIVLLVWRSRRAASVAAPQPAGSGSLTGPALSVNIFKQIRDDAVVQVVGEAYRQELVATARQPGSADLPADMPPPPPGYYKAMLVPEPTNQYDPNAIRVVLWAGESWALSGYLSREDAVLYEPLFRHLARDGQLPAVACDAALTPERGGIGVVLHLGTPGECIAELITDDRSPADHPWAGKAVAFTGRGRTTIAGVALDRYAQVMLARWAGCEVLPRLTKKTGALIVADPAEVTTNLQKARDYGVPIVQEPDFLIRIGLPAEAISHDAQRWARV